MNNAEIEAITAEFQTSMLGRQLGRVFPLSKLSIVIDFRLSEGSYLFISADPGDPRAYQIKRRFKDLEKQSDIPQQFVLAVRKWLSNAEIRSVSKLNGERVLVFEFDSRPEAGTRKKLSLVVQLTGRSANMFLLDPGGSIIDRLRETRGHGQEVGTRYSPPVRADNAEKRTDERIVVENGRTLSEILDERHLEKESAARFHSLAESARKKLRAEISKKKKLAEHLRGDLSEHGNADQWKRYGNLLLANSANAKRNEDRIIVTDFYDDKTPEIEIEGDPNSSISEVAEGYFKRYTKARNAVIEIARRRVVLDSELEKLKKEETRLEEGISTGDLSFFEVEKKPAREASTKKKRAENEFSGARKFISIDGFQILVGKKAKDNDYLTFRVAKSLDLWLHAADYPGSHVVVRNNDRREIPAATLIEAAQLAAFYSDAREQPKAAVNYTQKKFVNKPKGSAPGLVSLASFKTVLVQPIVTAKKETPPG
ncbi:MAG: NFACT family protein [Acidobacteriota bacterium]